MDCDCCYRNSCGNFCSMRGRNVGNKGKCLEDTGRTSGGVYGLEQLREYCGYDEGSNSYEYEMIYASPYPPFGEVVDYTKNADGTITLIVDGVWPDYNSDLAFRNTVVVQPFEDGTFRYLSNSIEQIELELPPIARTKG